MPGYKKFKGFMVEQGITQQEIAELLDVPRARVNLILNGQRGVDFRGKEIETLCGRYGISADDYFFDREVATLQLDEASDHD